MKVKLIKVLQDIRETNYIPNRRMPPKPTVLYLMQLRSHITDHTAAKQRLVIQVDLKDTQNLPRAVKITHL